MKHWWKILSVLLIVYSIVWGLKGEVPEMAILEQSIRNLYFHVPMWFAMMVIMLASLIHSLLYLSSNKIKNDIWACQAAKVGFWFGILGILTGMIWAKVTWGAWWVFQEVKLNGAAAGLLIYAAYFILRGSLDDERAKARYAAVYNIFAFVMYMVLINVIPRITQASLHPGNGGNPGFSSYDLENSLRIVFYPAVLGWILMAFWITTIGVRIEKIRQLKIDGEL